MDNKHLLVIDFEATCSEDDYVARTEMEIIELGAVMVEAGSQAFVDEFQSFVRPIRKPRLTEFCTELTSIQQSEVDAAPSFAEMMIAFAGWLSRFDDAVFCSWGDYDCRQLHQDCDYHSVPYPFDNRHINLKAEFAKQRRTRKMGLTTALDAVGLPLVGTHHRGIDDARNIARLIPFIYPKSAGTLGSPRSTGDTGDVKGPDARPS